MAQVPLQVLQCNPATADSQQLGWIESQDNLGDFCRAFKSSGRRCVIVFLDTPRAGPSASHPAYTLLSDTFGITKSYWSELCQEANGFFRGHTVSTTPGPSDEAICSEFRCLSKRFVAALPINGAFDYTWDKLAFATRWQVDGSVIMLCFDLTPTDRRRVCEAAKSVTFDYVTSNPFAFHHIAFSVVVQTFDAAVWGWRDVVRDFEKQRKDNKSPKANYIMMHEAGRHATHCTESLATALNVVHEIIDVNRYQQRVSSSKDAVHADLAYHRSLLNCLHLRAEAIETRLSNEINLVFHVNSQKDSLSAEKIARASQRENTTMKTIAVLGLVFLPGTLISAIFSTSFFDYSPSTEAGVWSVASQFWIYWAVTIPVTLLTLAFWFVWQWWQY